MALVHSWEKKRPYGLSDFKNREMLWLWCRLEVNGYELNHNLVRDAESRANHLIDSVADREAVRSLRVYRDECFSKRLDDSEFKWIDYHDRRLVHWILEMLEGRYLSVALTLTNFDQSVLKPHEQIKLAFDLSEEPIYIKKEAITSLRETWSTLIEVDPSLEWVDKRDDEQCRWLVGEIKKSDFARFISPVFQFPVNNEDRFLLVVNALDRSGVPLKFKTLFLGEIKAKWSRKKKKGDTEKVQCNLSVDSSTKMHIKKLAEGRGLKMGELIDALVVEEMQRLG